MKRLSLLLVFVACAASPANAALAPEDRRFLTSDLKLPNDLPLLGDLDETENQASADQVHAIIANPALSFDQKGDQINLVLRKLLAKKLAGKLNEPPAG